MPRHIPSAFQAWIERWQHPTKTINWWNSGNIFFLHLICSQVIDLIDLKNGYILYKPCTTRHVRCAGRQILFLIIFIVLQRNQIWIDSSAGQSVDGTRWLCVWVCVGCLCVFGEKKNDISTHNDDIIELWHEKTQRKHFAKRVWKAEWRRRDRKKERNRNIIQKRCRSKEKEKKKSCSPMIFVNTKSRVKFK